MKAGSWTSLARPGGNTTGLSTLGPELSGKRLELLKEIVPKLSRVAVLGTSTVPGHSQMMREIERAAKAFNVELQFRDILDSKSMVDLHCELQARGVLTLTSRLQSPIVFSQRAQILDLAVKNRLPAMYFHTEYVEAGGLMSYSANLNDLARRAATYVDKILKAKPADLPVEQPKKFEFIINLRAAEQIGLKIPPNVLARADRVIK